MFDIAPIEQNNLYTAHRLTYCTNPQRSQEDLLASSEYFFYQGYTK